jgi:hypothetical protein
MSGGKKGAIIAASLVGIALMALLVWLALSSQQKVVEAPRSSVPFFAEKAGDLAASADVNSKLVDPRIAKTNANAANAEEWPQEICNYGVAHSQEEMLQILPRMNADAARVLKAAIDELIARPSEKDLALGLWLRVVSASSEIRNQRIATCGFEERCFSKKKEQEQHSVEATIGPLVTLANRSRDPTIYAMTYNLCRTIPNAVCSSINAQGWRERDPENIMAILAAVGVWAASPPTETRQTERVAEMIAQAKSYSGRTPEVLSLYSTSALRDASPTSESAVMAAFGLQLSRDSMHGTSDVIMQCGKSASSGSDRMGMCSQIARTIAREATGLTDLIRSEIAARSAGWSPKELLQQRDELDRLLASTSEGLDARQPSSCEQLRRFNNRAREQAARGELTVLREMLANKKSDALKPADIR